MVFYRRKSQVGVSPTCGRRKSGKIEKYPPEFGRDHVARGSSWLKPLRRRAPTGTDPSPLRAPGVKK